MKTKKVLCILLVIALAVSGIAATKPAKVYEDAQEKMAAGEYEKAAELFESISSYEDSSKQAMYCKALAYGEKGDYDNAIKALGFLGDYKDSTYLIVYYGICKQAFANNATIGDVLSAADQFDAISVFRDSAAKAEQCRQLIYDEAMYRFNKGDYESAAYVFEQLENYKDSTDQIKNCQAAVSDREYNEAVTLMNEGKYSEAIKAFEALNGYKDSSNMIANCQTAILDIAYHEAGQLKESGKYSKAIDAFQKLNGYKDSKTQIEECQTAIKEENYASAMALKNSGKYSEAITVLQKLNGYKDSNTQIEECQTAIKEAQYQQALLLKKSGRYDEAYDTFLSIAGYKDVDSILKTDPDMKHAAYLAYLAQFQVGKTVTFGNYEQDNSPSNGKEAIEWLVLAREDNKALLISKYALDCQPYHSSRTDITWEKCSLRSWLNSTFLNSAFTSAEQGLILSSKVTADKNPKYNTSPGNDTTDKVFLLSITEVNKYFSSDSVRQCAGTKYCYAQGAYKANNGNCWWWLRSPGCDSLDAACVYNVGSVYYLANGVDSDDNAVRPALWIDLAS